MLFLYITLGNNKTAHHLFLKMKEVRYENYNTI